MQVAFPTNVKADEICPRNDEVSPRVKSIKELKERKRNQTVTHSQELQRRDTCIFNRRKARHESDNKAIDGKDVEAKMRETKRKDETEREPNRELEGNEDRNTILSLLCSLVFEGLMSFLNFYASVSN